MSHGCATPPRYSPCDFFLFLLYGLICLSHQTILRTCEPKPEKLVRMHIFYPIQCSCIVQFLLRFRFRYVIQFMYCLHREADLKSYTGAVTNIVFYDELPQKKASLVLPWLQVALTGVRLCYARVVQTRRWCIT
jgi:hypothetical protein